MSDELTIVHVARGRATNISVNKADTAKEDGHPMSVVPSECKYCEHLVKCMAKTVFKSCGGEFYVKKLPMESEVSNA